MGTTPSTHPSFYTLPPSIQSTLRVSYQRVQGMVDRAYALAVGCAGRGGGEWEGMVRDIEEGIRGVVDRVGKDRYQGIEESLQSSVSSSLSSVLSSPYLHKVYTVCPVSSNQLAVSGQDAIIDIIDMQGNRLRDKRIGEGYGKMHIIGMECVPCVPKDMDMDRASIPSRDKSTSTQTVDYLAVCSINRLMILELPTLNIVDTRKGMYASFDCKYLLM